jgi:hypothetical protein
MENTKTLWLAGIGAVLVLVLILVGRDLFRASPKTINCDDGSRQTIDIRDFATQYAAYSVQFEATVGDKAKFSGKLDPVQLQQLSESLQHANEFRKFLVAGYNSCAISKAQYGQFGTRFQAMDALSRQIDSVVSKPELAGTDRAKLGDLVKQYVDLSQRLATQ